MGAGLGPLAGHIPWTGRDGKWGRNEERRGALVRKQAASSLMLGSYSLGSTISPELEQVGGPARVRWADSHHPCPPSFSSWVLCPDSEVLRADCGQRSGIFLGFTGPALATCPDAMLTRQPLTMADSEGALPPIITTFQECPDSASFAHVPAQQPSEQAPLCPKRPSGSTPLLSGSWRSLSWPACGHSGPPTLTAMPL